MKLKQIIEDQTLTRERWLLWQEGSFQLEEKRPKVEEENRETLAHLYCAYIEALAPLSFEEASTRVRDAWQTMGNGKRLKTLPGIIANDPFLCHYALGRPTSVGLVRDLWAELQKKQSGRSNPIYPEWNPDASKYFDVDATPPGFLPKLFLAWRLEKDKELLSRARSDLQQLTHVEDHKRRRWLTLAILSHGAAYREIDGEVLDIPHFEKAHTLVSYTCTRHLIAEGVKTVSLVPTEKGIRGIYICQGTELWPSQSSMFGSIVANFARHGSATAAYAHSWRRIHKHLRDLSFEGPPVVAGHSMGGALAIQMGLYSHELIEEAFAFNPPLPNDRDYAFYNQLPPEIQNKIQVTTNLDDFAFWRIGACIVGNVTLFLGKKRWRYFPMNLFDLLLIFPALFKFGLNVRHAFPAHQHIVALHDQFISFKLSEEEKEFENRERLTRFDYLRFFPKLYDPMRTLMRWVRRIFGWGLEEEYLQNEIEIVALHERELIDTITDTNVLEIEHQLRELRRQKEILIKKLHSLVR